MTVEEARFSFQNQDGSAEATLDVGESGMLRFDSAEGSIVRGLITLNGTAVPFTMDESNFRSCECPALQHAWVFVNAIDHVEVTGSLDQGASKTEFRLFSSRELDLGVVEGLRIRVSASPLMMGLTYVAEPSSSELITVALAGVWALTRGAACRVRLARR